MEIKARESEQFHCSYKENSPKVHWQPQDNPIPLTIFGISFVLSRLIPKKTDVYNPCQKEWDVVKSVKMDDGR